MAALLHKVIVNILPLNTHPLRHHYVEVEDDDADKITINTYNLCMQIPHDVVRYILIVDLIRVDFFCLKRNGHLRSKSIYFNEITFPISKIPKATKP